MPMPKISPRDEKVDEAIEVTPSPLTERRLAPVVEAMLMIWPAAFVVEVAVMHRTASLQLFRVEVATRRPPETHRMISEPPTIALILPVVPAPKPVFEALRSGMIFGTVMESPLFGDMFPPVVELAPTPVEFINMRFVPFVVNQSDVPFMLIP